jgi:hypothetical protein
MHHARMYNLQKLSRLVRRLRAGTSLAICAPSYQAFFSPNTANFSAPQSHPVNCLKQFRAPIALNRWCVASVEFGYKTTSNYSL